MNETLAFQPELRQRLPDINGNLDYNNFRSLLLRMEEVIDQGQLEDSLIRFHVGQKTSQLKLKKAPSKKRLEKWTNQARVAFRCNLILRLQKFSYRGLALHLADSPLS